MVQAAVASGQYNYPVMFTGNIYSTELLMNSREASFSYQLVTVSYIEYCTTNIMLINLIHRGDVYDICYDMSTMSTNKLLYSIIIVSSGIISQQPGRLASCTITITITPKANIL